MRRTVSARTVRLICALPYPLRRLVARLLDNRWLYVGQVHDPWGTAWQIQATFWRRDRRPA